MSAWLVAVVLLLPPLTIAMAATLRGAANQRLAAMQMASGLCAMILAAMTFAFDQPSFADLALCLALLSVPGTLLYTMFMERFL